MPTDAPSPRLHAAFWGLLIAFLAIRTIAVFTLNINWDEFALLQRAELAARSGAVIGGGRPGLGTLVLMPLAAGCTDAIGALTTARLLWTFITAAAVWAFWRLLFVTLPPSPHRWMAAATGIALWCLAAPFLRFSVQLRTDHPAVLMGLLGGLVLVKSRVRPLLALAAGILFGVGFLFSQKLLYVGAITGVLALGHVMLRDDVRPAREAARAAATLAGFLVVVFLYRAIVSVHTAPPSLLPVGGAMRTFEYYREAIGWRFYRDMLPLIVPQIICFILWLGIGIYWLLRRGIPTKLMLVTLLVVATGTGVVLFHAARFQYSWIVLGLYPATLGALTLAAALPVLERSLHRLIVLMSIWIPLLATAAGQAAFTVIDDQAHQRASLRFVQRNFAFDARGHSGLGAFVCREDENPFPVWFHEHLTARFNSEPAASQTTDWLIREFRERPVVYFVGLQSWEQYPDRFKTFLDEHYVHYFGAVHLPGRSFSGGEDVQTFEVIVPGAYVWRSDPAATPLSVGGVSVPPGASVRLDAGAYTVRSDAPGMLVLAVEDSPAPDEQPFFTSW